MAQDISSATSSYLTISLFMIFSSLFFFKIISLDKCMKNALLYYIKEAVWEDIRAELQNYINNHYSNEYLVI